MIRDWHPGAVNPGDLFLVQDWRHEHLIHAVTLQGIDKARDVALRIQLSGSTARIMACSADYCEVFPADRSPTRIGTLAFTTLVHST